jgi:predicted nucleic acid-binding protein
MSIPVLYDACVLYGNEVRDLLIRIAISGMVRAHWTDEILDETFGNLTANRPDLSPERLMVTRERMNAAVPGALVSGYETLVEALKLSDPDDRHVLAAAITAGATVIVTSNLNDFPAETLEQHGIEAKIQMTSCSTRSALMRAGSVTACTRSPAAGRGHRRPTKRSSMLSNGPAWSVPRRHRGTEPMYAAPAGAKGDGLPRAPNR